MPSLPSCTIPVRTGDSWWWDPVLKILLMNVSKILLEQEPQVLWYQIDKGVAPLISVLHPSAALSYIAGAAWQSIFKRAVRSHILHIQLFLLWLQLVFWKFHSCFQHVPVWHQLLLRKLPSSFTGSVQKASIDTTNFPIFLAAHLHCASIQNAESSWATCSQREEEEGNM